MHEPCVWRWYVTPCVIRKTAKYVFCGSGHAQGNRRPLSFKLEHYLGHFQVFCKGSAVNTKTSQCSFVIAAGPYSQLTVATFWLDVNVCGRCLVVFHSSMFSSFPFCLEHTPCWVVHRASPCCSLLEKVQALNEKFELSNLCSCLLSATIGVEDATRKWAPNHNESGRQFRTKDGCRASQVRDLTHKRTETPWQYKEPRSA